MPRYCCLVKTFTLFLANDRDVTSVYDSDIFSVESATFSSLHLFKVCELQVEGCFNIIYGDNILDIIIENG